jgi:hypothetical protein
MARNRDFAEVLNEDDPDAALSGAVAQTDCT